MNRERNWHMLTTAELERVFRTESARGLSDKEAERRLRHGKNTVWEVKTASAKRYALRSFLDLCTVLLVLTVFACAFFESAHMAVAICVMLLLGRAARIAVYIWAERTLEKNAAEALPRVKVVRDGTVKVVASDMVAPGDVIILDSGDTVPCDIRLTAADNVLVSEAGVTGAEGIVSKSSELIVAGGGGEVPVAMRTNTVYASSTVISGFAIGIAVATGDNTLVCTREGRIVLAGEKDVSTVERLSDWGRIASLCLIAASLVITVIGIAFGAGGLADMFVPSIAMAASGLSEYIAAIGTFAWAKKLASDDGCVLLKASIAEKAANTELLVLRNACVMKSGVTTLHSYYTDGSLTMMGTKDAKAPGRLLRLACYCTGASCEGGIVSGNFGTRRRAQGSLSYRLIRNMYEEHKSEAAGGDVYSILQHMPAGDVDSLGLDNVLLSSGNDFFFACMGELSDVLSMSSYYKVNGERRHLDDDERKKIIAYGEELVRHGVTIAAVGFRDSHYNNLRRISALHQGLCFEGFIAVADRPAPSVVSSIRELREAGGRVLLFSERGIGDKLYCEAEGIFKTGDLYISKEESRSLRSLSLEEGSLTLVETEGASDGIRERLRIMKLCRESGLCVSYVGFGIEDMWNMKNADVVFAVPSPQGGIPQGIRTSSHGIAEGEGGGFGAVCTLMDKCRAALVNIRSALKYLVTSHVARLVLMLTAAASGMVLPGASSLVFWGVIVDFLVALATVTVSGSGKVTNLRAGRLSASPDTPSQVILPTMYGALLALLSVGTPFAARAVAVSAGFAASLTSESVMTVCVSACILAMPLIGAEYAGGYGLLSKRSRLSLWFVLPFAAAVTGACLLLFAGGLREAFGTQFPGFIMSAAALVPSVIIVAVMSVVRAVNKNH